MYKLDDKRLDLLLNSGIHFHYKDRNLSWIKNGIVKVPKRRIDAERYSSYFVPTEFYPTGAFSYSWSPLPENVSLGRYCSLASQIEIFENSHPTNLFTTSSMLYDDNLGYRVDYYSDNNLLNNDAIAGIGHSMNGAEIIVGNDVYIGKGAKLRPGITIGNGAIIGAYSVVTRSVEPYAVVAGNPGRVLKKRFSESVISELNKIEWWNYEFSAVLQLSKACNGNIERFISCLGDMINNNGIRLFQPSAVNIAEYF